MYSVKKLCLDAVMFVKFPINDILKAFENLR